MAYEVLARKWRPQRFDEIVGQQHVTQTLKNAIESDRVAHAYLFVGPRGVGKTSIARILAKALNCQKGPTGEPCGKCDSCKEIMGGNGLDVLEIDAASNTGVDNVRDLRDNVRYAPARGPFKIYIIDEVHMLSTAAFNALLKTLEEPPRHVKFLFATTEPQKVPATILSRCQRFDLHRISTKDIVGRLSEIASAEKVKIDQDALLAIARGAEGGLRDAESAMDQLIAFRGKSIKEEDVLSVFGLVARQMLEGLAQSILDGNISKAIELVAELDESGKDIQRAVLELLEHFRNILICQYAGESIVGLDLTEGQVATIKTQAGAVDAERALRVLDILSEAENRMRFALSRRTLLETAVIRCARAVTTVSLDALIGELNRLKSSMGAGGSPAREESSYSPKAQRPAAAARETMIPPARPVAHKAVASAAATEPEGGEDELKSMVAHWHEMVDRIGHTAVLAKGYLLDAKPVSITGNTVTIGFDPEFATNKDKIDFPRNRNAIKQVLGEVLKRDVNVEFTVLDSRSTLPGDIKLKQTHPGTEAAPASQTKAALTAKTRLEWIKDPTVRKTLEMFNGDIIDVRE